DVHRRLADGQDAGRIRRHHEDGARRHVPERRLVREPKKGAARGRGPEAPQALARVRRTPTREDRDRVLEESHAAAYEVIRGVRAGSTARYRRWAGSSRRTSTASRTATRQS